VKQAHHLLTRAKEILHTGVGVFEQNAVVKPAPKKQENQCADKREQESFNVHAQALPASNLGLKAERAWVKICMSAPIAGIAPGGMDYSIWSRY